MEEVAGIPRLRWRRIIPVAIVMYTISFMDRINTSFAVAGMSKSFGLTATGAGLILGLFFIGYLLLQVPGGYWAHRWSAKKFVFWLLLIWGVFAALSGLAQNTTEELWCRFLLGVAEGGIWPAVLVLLANWFPKEERARANGLWLICLPLAAAITSPISGFLVSAVGWRLMLILEGIPPLIWAAIWWWGVEDRPSQASWLSAEERNYIESKLALEQHSTDETPWTVLLRPSVWILAIAYFLTILGGYGLNLWAPTIVKSLGIGFLGTGLLLIIPNAAAVWLLIYAGRVSDRIGKRIVVAAAVLAISFIGYLLLGLVGTSVVVLAIVFLSLATAGFYARQGPLWSVPSEVLPTGTAGTAMGLINGIGNVGGFVGPYVMGYLKTTTHSFTVGYFTMGMAILLGAGLLFLVKERRPDSIVMPQAG